MRANVTDFTNALGYCEYKIPFYAKNIYVTTAEMQRGEEHHEMAEKTERETAVLVPLEPEELNDKEQDISFVREDIRATFTRDFEYSNGPARLTLFGRADKVMRSDSTLIITDDKTTGNPSSHANRTEPYPDQILQVLTYLHSKFYFGEKFGGWIEIPHSSKMYELNIVDAQSREISKTYREVVGERHVSMLDKYASLFAFKCLQWVPLEHHNNKNKCRPCGYFKDCAHAIR